MDDFRRATHVMVGLSALSHDATERKKAEEWLVQFRKNDACWQLSLALLAHPGEAQPPADTDELLFVAQTLVAYSRKAHHIPQEDMQTLLPLCLHYAASRRILTQLALAVSAVALRQAAWPVETIVSDLIGFFTPYIQSGGDGEPEAAATAALTLLTVLPEEGKSETMYIVPQRRADIHTHFRLVDAPVVSELIISCATTRSQHVQQLAFGALRAWVVHAGMEWAALHQPLSLAFELLPSTAEGPGTVAEAIAAALETHTSGAAMAVLMPAVLGVVAAMPDHEAVAGLAVTCGTHSLHLLGEGALHEAFGQLFEALLQYLSHPNLRIATNAVEFWGKFSDSTHVAGHDEHAASLAQQACLRVILRTKYPEGYAELSDQEREDFSEYREGVRGVLRDLLDKFPQLGPWLLTSIYEHMNEIVDSGLCAIPEASWAQAEALLHGLSAATKHAYGIVDGLEETQTKLLRLLPMLPCVPGLQCTIAVLLRVIRPWFMRHPECLPLAIDALIHTLEYSEDDEVYPMRIHEDHVGAIALDFLTSVPGAEVCFDKLLQTYQSHLSRFPWVITPAAMRFVLGAVAQTVAHMQGEEPVGIAIHALVTLLTERLQEQSGDEAAVIFLLESFKVLASHLQNKHHPALVQGAFLAVFTDKTGLVLGVLQPNAGNEAIVKAAHEVCIALMLSESASSPEFAQAICGVFVHIYLKHHWAAALDVVKVCVEQYGGNGADDSSRPTLMPDLPEWLEGILQASGAEALVQQAPGVSEALFNLLCAVASHAPGVLAQYMGYVYASVLLPVLTAPSAVLADGQASTAILAFVQATLSAKDPQLCATVEAHMSSDEVSLRLMYGLLSCICGWSPSWMLEDQVATLRTWFSLHGPDACCRWAAAAMSQPEFPRFHVSDAAKAAFLEDMSRLAAEGQWTKFKNTVKKFCGGKKKNMDAGTPATPKKG